MSSLPLGGSAGGSRKDGSSSSSSGSGAGSSGKDASRSSKKKETRMSEEEAAAAKKEAKKARRRSASRAGAEDAAGELSEAEEEKAGGADDANDEEEEEQDEGSEEEGVDARIGQRIPSLGLHPAQSSSDAASVATIAAVVAEAKKAEKEVQAAQAKAQAAKAKLKAIQASAIAAEANSALDETSGAERAAAQQNMQRLVEAEVAAFTHKAGVQLTPAQVAAFTLHRTRELYAEHLEAAMAQQRAENAALVAQLQQQQQQQVPHTPFAAASSHIPLARQPRLLASPGGVLGSGPAGLAALAPPSSSHRAPKQLSEEKKLYGNSALEKGRLEDWIFGVEAQMDGLVSTYAEQLLYVRRNWDRPVNDWFTGASAVAAAMGRPIDSWQRLVEALRANYTPFSDEDEARRALKNIAMKGGEPMSAYVARASELYNRTNRVRVSTETAADFLLDGLAASQFPITSMEITRRGQAARKAGGTGLTFEAVGPMLVELSVSEPTKVIQQQRQASESSGSFRPAPSKSRGGYGGNRTRVNTLGGGGGGRNEERGQQRYPDEGECEEDYDSDEHFQTNVMREATCFRCKSKDHFIADCREKETRTCPICNVKGHVRFSCPKNQQPGGGAQASRGRGGRGGRGRASSGAGSSPSPKNE
jgi:hypothetical protein